MLLAQVTLKNGKKAMDDEIVALLVNETLVSKRVTVPKNNKVLPCKWVYEGCKKAWTSMKLLVIRATIRTVLSLAGSEQISFNQFDVFTAFL